MVLDLILFRSDQGGDPDKIRETQKKRFKDVSHVEKVIETDTRWRKRKTRVCIVQHTPLPIIYGVSEFHNDLTA